MFVGLPGGGKTLRAETLLRALGVPAFFASQVLGTHEACREFIQEGVMVPSSLADPILCEFCGQSFFHLYPGPVALDGFVRTLRQAELMREALMGRRVVGVFVNTDPDVCAELARFRGRGDDTYIRRRIGEAQETLPALRGWFEAFGTGVFDVPGADLGRSVPLALTEFLELFAEWARKLAARDIW